MTLFNWMRSPTAKVNSPSPSTPEVPSWMKVEPALQPAGNAAARVAAPAAKVNINPEPQGININGLTVRPISAGMPRIEIIKKAIVDALGELHRSTLAPVSEAAQGSIYRLDSIELIENQGNMAVLEALVQLDPEILKRMALDCIDKAAGEKLIKRKRFFGMSVQRELELAKGEVVQVHASDGGARVPFDIVFNGKWEFEERRRDTPLRLLPLGKKTQGSGPVVMQLIVQHQGEEDFSHTLCTNDLPAKVGHEVQLPVRAVGQWVSGEHILLEMGEHEGSRTVLATDLSKNGTWLNGKQLPPGQPTPLLGNGTLILGSPIPGADVPCIKFALAQVVADVPAQANYLTQSAPIATPVVQATVMHAPATQTMVTQPVVAPVPASAPTPAPVTAQLAVAPPAPVSPAMSVAAAHALPLAAPMVEQVVNSSPAQDAKPAEMQIVMLPSPADLPDNPNGYPLLRERRADGTEVVHVIDEFPFEIGREPDGDAAIVLDDELDFVSRSHLCIESLHGRDGLNVVNKAWNKRGTWRDGRALDHTFLWQAARPGSRQAQVAADGGWITLGDKTLNPRAVQFRLEAAGGKPARAAQTCLAAVALRPQGAVAV